MEDNIHYSIDCARKAQQEHEQKHDVQLEVSECEGHPSDENHPMGETWDCDGSCKRS